LTQAVPIGVRFLTVEECERKMNDVMCEVDVWEEMKKLLEEGKIIMVDDSGPAVKYRLLTEGMPVILH
jgi:hypothetical protein